MSSCALFAARWVQSWVQFDTASPAVVMLRNMGEPGSLAVVRSYDELVAALSARRDELQITFLTLDDLSGIQVGYSAKLLSPGRVKKLGCMSLTSLLGALALKLIVVEDPEQLAKVRSRLTRRRRPKRQAEAEPDRGLYVGLSR